MLFNQACKIDDGLQPRVSRPPEPLYEMGLSSFFLEVITKPLEFLLEVVSPDDREGDMQLGESATFLGSQISRVLEQD